jgi:hypothetical protein
MCMRCCEVGLLRLVLSNLSMAFPLEMVRVDNYTARATIDRKSSKRWTSVHDAGVLDEKVTCSKALHRSLGLN